MVAAGFAVTALAAVDSAAPLNVSNGAVVTVSGSGFGTAPAAFLRNTGTGKKSKAKVSKAPAATDVTFQFECPAALAGAYALDVFPKGVKTPFTLPGFTLDLPTIGTVVPATGEPKAAVTIHGGFFGAKKGKILLGTKKCKVTSWTNTQIAFEVPKLAAGAVDVTVTNSAGASVPKAGGFTVAGPAASGDQLAFAAGSLEGDIEEAGNITVVATSTPEAASHRFVVQALEAKPGATTTVRLEFVFADAAPMPVTVNGSAVSISLTKSVGFPPYPSEDYLGTGTADPQDVSSDVEVTIHSIVGGVVNGSFRGTMKKGALGTLGNVVFIAGTFTATVE